MDKNKALELDKQKRKAVATKRICTVLAVLDIALIVYIAIQIIMLIQK